MIFFSGRRRRERRARTYAFDLRPRRSRNKYISQRRRPYRGANAYLLRFAAAGLLLIAFAAAGIFSLTKNKADVALACMVSLGGRDVAVIENADGLLEAVEARKLEYEQEYGMEIVLEQPVITPVRIDKSNISPQEAAQDLVLDALKPLVRATVITISDIPAVALKSRDDAEWVLEQAKKPYIDASERFDITGIAFLEQVQVSEMDVPHELLMDKEAAAELLITGQDESAATYEVVAGDNLWRIAERNNIRIADLRIANPAVAATDEIIPGQMLKIMSTKALLHITYTMRIERIESMDYETIVRDDDTMLETQRKVTTAGEAGEREIVAQATYINGMESSYEILSQTVLKEPVNEVVAKGTMPVTAGNGVTVYASGYALPLMPGSYRISSEFGQRWGRLHAGLDMAAPEGTPIYASRSGTVTRSGYNGGYGKSIDIDHGSGTVTRYGHCSKLLVSVGDKVQQGDLIALVGNTGNSTGPHLHFEVRIDGSPTDPANKLK